MSVTIGNVTSIGGDPPTSIIVVGTASGCECVEVQITCGPPNQTVTSQAVPCSTVRTGTWTAVFSNTFCRCADQIRVDASCARGQGTGSDSKAFANLNCPPPTTTTTTTPTTPTTPTTGTGTTGTTGTGTTGTGTTPTTPTTPTTGTGTTGTGTTGTTGTTPTTPPPSGGGGIGCLCAMLLIPAMILTAVAGVLLTLWGCTGGFNPALLVAAVGAGVAAIVAFVLWMILCRDCPSITFLSRFFAAMALLMFVVAALLALIGQPGCAQGVAAVGVLFLTVAGTLAVGRAVLGCP
jgi:hypothetical protein